LICRIMAYKGRLAEPVAQELRSSMAWERSGKRKYFYRSVRNGDKVRRDYYGAGQGGQIAAAADALNHAERKAHRETARKERKVLHDAVALVLRLNEWCDLVTAAALLAAGFHRPRRHDWRVWRYGREFLKRSR